MNSITRRDTLRGATAAVVVTGAITAPLAIKAAGVKAALAGNPGARFALALGSAGNVRTTTLKGFTEQEFREIVGSLP